MQRAKGKRSTSSGAVLRGADERKPQSRAERRSAKTPTGTRIQARQTIAGSAKEVIKIEDFLDLPEEVAESFHLTAPSGRGVSPTPKGGVVVSPATPSTFAGSPSSSGGYPPQPSTRASGAAVNTGATRETKPEDDGEDAPALHSDDEDAFADEDDPNFSKSFLDIPSRSMSKSFHRRSSLRKMLFQVAPKKGVGKSDFVLFGDLQPIDSNGDVCSLLEEREGSFDGRRKSMPGARRGSVMVTMPQSSILGEGQYGLVWRARSELTGKWYAVKNVKGRTNDDDLNVRELDIARRICKDPHPCMVRCFQIHTFDDGTLSALVMEFARRGDLQGQIRAKRRSAAKDGHFYIPPPLSLQWIGQVFLGIEYMHFNMKLLFRDLKPGNVVLTSDGHAKITDFGLSRVGVKSEGAWSFGFPTGSPGFTAPEIMDQEEYDQSADMYSFGVLIFVILSGGVVDKEEPAPPVNQVDEDWELMERSLADPDTYAAELLGEHQSNLVGRLTRREPSERATHDDVRTHPLLEHMWFPARAAASKVVEEWLQGLKEGS